MVAIRFGLLLLASALTAQACTYCQCLFDSGDHCCVYSVRDVTYTTPTTPTSTLPPPPSLKKDRKHTQETFPPAPPLPRDLTPQAAK